MTHHHEISPLPPGIFIPPETWSLKEDPHQEIGCQQEITGLHKTIETLEGACLEVVPPCMRDHVTRVWAVERSMLEEETEIFHHLEIT